MTDHHSDRAHPAVVRGTAIAVLEVAGEPGTEAGDVPGGHGQERERLRSHGWEAAANQSAACPACSGQAIAGREATGRCTVLCECVATTVRRELAGPVAEVRAYLEALAAATQGDGDLASTLLGRALAAAERVQEVTTALVANPDTSQPLQVDDVDLSDVVAAVVADLDDLAGRRDARVSFGQLPTVRGDRGLLYHLVSAVMRNALTHGGAQVTPTVVVTGRRLGTDWVVQVADDGEGMSASEWERVFDLFDEDADREAGQGLGLSTAKRVVERHGGRIWMEEASGGGTVVSFTLPAASR
ncbi:sensor histidine kinase [Euzebya sp.]|uniref:sensor histidine kinase n=1 Tax=Euzebya sp. TaxID=1971409 RepID=UPI003516C764